MNSKLPYLAKDAKGIKTLYVDGCPYLLLGGELRNSSSSSLVYMQEKVWLGVAEMNLNTLILPVAWESIEKEEGVFDFSLLEGLVKQAREHEIRLVILWFGLWKNGESMYVPSWVKEDIYRFFRIETSPGVISNTVSPFCMEAAAADKKAFVQMMRHIKVIDEAENTIIMVQVENEIGVLEAERDFSIAAEKQYQTQLPIDVGEMLGKTGSWEEAFGEDAPEYFMGYAYARVVEEITAAGKAEYPLPMYVNAWLEQFPQRPGIYPSGGPIAKLISLWKIAAPSIDFYAPDIYLPQFKKVCDEYVAGGNPLFIPEARRDPVSAANVFYAFGEYNALGFSPFGIEELMDPLQPLPEDTALTKELNIDIEAFCGAESGTYIAQSYKVLHSLQGFFWELRGTPALKAFLQENSEDRGTILSMSQCDIMITYRKQEYRKPSGGGIILETEPNTFILAGCRFHAKFLPKKGSGQHMTLISLEEGEFAEGNWQPRRVLNGDERGDSRHEDFPGVLLARVHLI